jgi:hypothetical protein
MSARDIYKPLNEHVAVCLECDAEDDYLCAVGRKLLNQCAALGAQMLAPIPEIKMSPWKA